MIGEVFVLFQVYLISHLNFIYSKLEKFHFFQFRKSRPWGRKNLLDSILQESIIFNKDKRYQKTLRKVLPVTKKPFLLRFETGELFAIYHSYTYELFRNVASGQRHFPWYLSMVEEFNNTVKPEEAFTAILQSNTESPNEVSLVLK